MQRFEFYFFFSSRRRHTRCLSDWSSDVCSSDLADAATGDPTNDLVVVDLDQQHGGQLAVEPLEGIVERLRLLDIAGKAVEQEAVGAGRIAKIGRASCRERVESSGVGGASKEEKI